jgi:uroporphyrinogen decarboxylase
MPLTPDQYKAMTFQNPEAIPVQVYFLPAAWMKHREALETFVERYPALFGPVVAGRDYDAVGGTYVEGEHIDAWGCVWSNLQTGMEAIVTGHPVPTRADVRRLRAPRVDAGLPHGFMYLRLGDLRGFEELMLDFAEEPPELQMLIDTVLEYNLRQADNYLRSLPPGEMAVFGDDLGMQTGLAMGARKWRKYLKPCYQRLYAPFRAAGHPVYMHTDGHILEIIPDLVECGVTVINPQSRANGLENLARLCRGKVCIDLDLDRQLMPFGSPAEIEAHVREAVQTLATPAGGLWLKAEVNYEVPLENVEALCAALEKFCF